MKNSIVTYCLGVSLCVLTATTIADQLVSLPLTSLDNTQARGVIATPEHYKGRDALKIVVDPDHKSIEQGGCDNCTYLSLEDTDFSNGVIEIDLAGKPSEGAPDWARGFVGVVFRVNEAHSDYEGFYLRPMNALEEEPRRNNTSQYFSIPGHPWHKLRKEFPGKYEAYADIVPGEWFTLRIEVEGEKSRFFINDNEIMVVESLFNGPDLTGTIGLFTEPQTDAYFSNLRITSR